ncbi:MAG: putative ORFan [Satyrvirus sp.]|uniref:Putative ORFan n=1 Tax=Satyrvirus sp. TaxID=2487771 RepID=A0A3G5AGR0_9VIRU|nr:MAG: putative ORFan [Satyrvirus sp.]
MFFSAIHITVGKYYPNLFMQIIFGSICYVIFFFIIKSICPDVNYEKYKYCILFVIIFDIILLVYLTRFRTNSKNSEEKIDVKNELGAGADKVLNPNSLSLNSTSLSSEANDFKVTHDPSSSDENYSIFSTSENKTPAKIEQTTKKILNSSSDRPNKSTEISISAINS